MKKLSNIWFEIVKRNKTRNMPMVSDKKADPLSKYSQSNETEEDTPLCFGKTMIMKSVLGKAIRKIYVDILFSGFLDKLS